MFKNITFTFSLLLVFSLSSFSQDKFVYDINGLSPDFLVVEMSNIEQNDLFTRTINWIKETYKNPDEVIKTTIENKKVRFEGFRDNLISINSLGLIYNYYGLYTIEISFKDNKYKFTPISVEYRVPASQYSSGGFIPVNFNDGSVYFNKKGKLRKMYASIPNSIESLFNDLNEDLKIYLTKENNGTNEDDDW
tara:strand:+ start:240 stop:815 length:576 start_codon:yes stop_codon:yes gene_type:complete